MADSEWEAQKAKIERLYLRENKSLKELRQVMGTTYNFRKTKYQYESQFKRWGFKKYRMGADKWKYVKRQMEKRNAEGRQTEVYINGYLCAADIVHKETSRQGFEREIEKYHRGASPGTPEGIIICSPGPSVVYITWPRNLPWFIFSDAAPLTSQSTIGSPPRSLTRMSTVLEGDQVLQLKGLPNALSSFLMQDQTQIPRAVRSVSQFASALSSIMPEQRKGQNLHIAQQFCSVAGSGDIVEFVRVALFMLANNFSLTAPVRRRIGRRTRIIVTSKEKLQAKEDQAIMTVFHMSGLNTAHSLRQLLSIKAVAAQAIAEKLFASAVRTCDIDAIRMLLNAGMAPDTPIHHGNVTSSPVRVAAGVRNASGALEMTSLLLSLQGVSQSSDELKSALYRAIRSKNQGLVKLLLSREARPNGFMLSQAITDWNSSIVNMLLDVDCDIGKHDDILGLAVQRNDIPLVEKLLAQGAQLDIVQRAQVPTGFCTTALGLAAELGAGEMIDCLLRAGTNVNHASPVVDYVAPLVVAVASGKRSAVERLIVAGADVRAGDATGNKTLVARALDRHDLEMARMLMANGASVDGGLIESYYTPILYEKVQQCEDDTVRLLLNWGARVDETHDRVPDTVLGAAIARADCDMLPTLLLAGATNTGQALIKIGSVEIAQCLEEFGMLSDILLRCGQPILVSAIAQEAQEVGSGLVQFLLDHDVDRQPESAGVQPFGIRRRDHDEVSRVTTSPLAAAISWRNVPLAETLIRRGALVTDVELTAAIDGYRSNQDYDFVSMLLAQTFGFSIATPNAFAKAIELDHPLFLIQRLLDASLSPRGKVVVNSSAEHVYLRHLLGANIYCQQYEKSGAGLLESVLEKGAQHANASAVKLLLQATTWSPAEKGRALTASMHYKHRHLIDELLNANADVNQELSIEKNRVTPLLLAIEMRDIALTNRLMAAGADLGWRASTSLTLLQTAVDIGDTQIVQALIRGGADVNHPATMKGGNTALQAAIAIGDVRLVEVLLEGGADVRQPAPPGGKTALQTAVDNRMTQIVEILLQAGADVNEKPGDPGGVTALQLAAIRGYIEIAHKLIERGADINATGADRIGRTALEGAADNGRLDVLQLLLNEGVSIEGPGRRQYIRAVKLAERNKQHAAAQLLRDHGSWSESDARQYNLEEVWSP